MSTSWNDEMLEARTIQQKVTESLGSCILSTSWNDEIMEARTIQQKVTESLGSCICTSYYTYPVLNPTNMC